MNDFIFDNEFIKNIKKTVVNYISRTNVNINKVTYNLSLYTNFVIEGNDTSIKRILPSITPKGIIPATIIIGEKYFNKRHDAYYVRQDAEDDLIIKLTRIFIEAASIKIEYNNNNIPTSISTIGFMNSYGNGFHNALIRAMAEEANNYIAPDFLDIYSFNKGIIRMIIAILGNKCVANSFFNHDKGLFVAMYSLSVDNNLFIKINDKLTLIGRLINTLNNDQANFSSERKSMLEKIIKLKEENLINLIFNKLYIPYINSVYVDKRKQVRDEILKGFLGCNYTNLKLTNENKNNYYWASLVNNSISINNKITEQGWAYFREQANLAEEKLDKEIRAMDALYKNKNNIKEFLVVKDNNGIKINNGKKIITDKKEVLEMLSYAYISSIDIDLKEKIELGITKLCETKTIFTSSLKGNPLSDEMLIAAITVLAKKNGYKIELQGLDNNTAVFKVKEKI